MEQNSEANLYSSFGAARAGSMSAWSWPRRSLALLCGFFGILMHLEAQQMRVAQTELERELRAGNLAVLDKLTGREALPILYQLLLLSERQQFGGWSSTIQSALVRNVSAIPGHADYLEKLIEENSSQAGKLQARETAFLLLSVTGSSAALEVLGRFLFDDRNPDEAIIQELPLADRTFPVLPNSVMAANGIGRILGRESPVAKKPGFYGSAEVELVRKWWRSPEGELFRKGF